ncbi:CobW family GTP-binding protein [Paracoccus yeei]|uniref:CobW family GTP-binding protein n=1 Tax=Paracoccus yeei TaxID=147645 RepID=UPI001C8F1A45|nr:GTP-binding protein [Paracoccus yeei]MBY0134983.1 GTP-binding protein [Paracoccus yeei]
MIPVFVVTGFLGAGKTTLVNRLLAAHPDTALIINEFGAVAVDHHLVRQGRERVLTSTGCICCKAGSDLRSTLDELLRGRRDGSLPGYARVLVETTGLADPAPIVNSLIPGGLPAVALRDHAVARAFRLSSVITVADAQGIAALVARHAQALRQVAFADHLVLSHTDLGPPGDLSALKAINPGLRVHDAGDPAFDPGLLLAPGSYDAAGKGAALAGWLAEAKGASGPRHGGMAAHALMADAPLDRARLMEFLAGLVAGGQVLRAKGLVAAADDPSRPLVVHAVGHRLYPPVVAEAWPEGPAGSRLVVIGEGLDGALLQRRFAALAGPTRLPGLGG